MNAKKAESFVKRVESIMDEIASERGKYMKRCRELRDDIKDILGEAKASGIPSKALRGILTYRDLEKKQQALSDGLDLDEQSAFEQMIEKLGDFGDTALGRAAIDKAKPKGDEARH